MKMKRYLNELERINEYKIFYMTISNELIIEKLIVKIIWLIACYFLNFLK